MDKKLSSVLLTFVQSRARLRTRRRAKKEERRRRGKTSTKKTSPSSSSSSTARENDEIVVFRLLLRIRPLLFVVVVSTSECGGAVGGKDFGDVVARVSRARVLKRPPETRLRRRDAPRAD